MSLKINFFVILLSANLLQIVLCDIRPGKYRLENAADGLAMTAEGGGAAFAKVVGENWQNFSEQKWQVRKTDPQIYEFSPGKYTSNNVLSFYKDPTKKYPSPERFTLTPIKGAYQVRNNRTGLCLTTAGRRLEIQETKCDTHLRRQHWNFMKL